MVAFTDNRNGNLDIYVRGFIPTPAPTAEEQIGSLMDEVEALLDAGSLNSGEARSLTSKLQNALDVLDRGNPTAAINQLQAFIDEVQAFIEGGVLTAAQGQPLIDAATAAIESI